MITRSANPPVPARSGALCIAMAMVLAAQAQADCKAKAFAVMEQIRTDLEQAEQNRLYSKVVVTTKPTDPNEQISKETMELISGDQRTAYVTQQLHMLEDQQVRAVVLPMDRLVYLYDHVPVEKGPNETWWKFTDQAFTTGKLLSCKETTGPNGDVVTAEFDVAAIKEMNGVKKLRFTLDATHARPLAYRSLFGPNGPLQERTFDFLAFEPGKADARVMNGVLAQIIPNGKLTSSLRDYELKDMRTKKTATPLPKPRTE